LPLYYYIFILDVLQNIIPKAINATESVPNRMLVSDTLIGVETSVQLNKTTTAGIKQIIPTANFFSEILVGMRFMFLIT
jgi:hypothetical protein